VNWSHGHPVSRLHIPFGVAQGSTIKRVQIAVLEAAKIHSEVLHYPQPQLLFNGFGDASLNFDLVVWIREPRHQVQIKSDLYYLLEANLRRYRIELPLQQQEIKLRSAHLDTLMAALTSVEGESLSSPPSAPTSPVDPLPADTDDWLADLKDCVFGWQHETLTIPEMQALVAQMRGDGGLEIKDRRYGLSVYAKCFVGSDAVAWLVQTQKATQEAAVRIGQQLMEQGMLHHVADEHPFRDDYLFYRFYLDEREDP
jgi:potassium-dependent mechanosensitive channel